MPAHADKNSATKPPATRPNKTNPHPAFLLPNQRIMLKPQRKELKRPKPIYYPEKTIILEVHFTMQQKGQGSLEYLLIIGGGILVAVIIIGAIVTLAGQGSEGPQLTLAEQACNSYTQDFQCRAATVSGVAVSGAPACPTSYSNGTNDKTCCWTTLETTDAAYPELNKRCVLATNAVTS